MMQFMLLFSRQGKLRLQKWFLAFQEKAKKKILRDLVSTILARKPKMSAFLEYKDLKIVYKRYASLYFCCAIEQKDNELLCLEIIHRYVELLDKYFGSVCELDIIFNFEKAYFILDEFLLAGEVQETSKKQVLKAIAAQDLLQEPTYIPGMDTEMASPASATICKSRHSHRDAEAEEYELQKRLPPRFPTRKNDVYVTKRTNFKAQLERCQKLLDKGFNQIFIHGLGAAVNRAINLALQLKRRGAGTLDMDINTSTLEVTDDLFPLIDDLDARQRIRNVSAIHIRLFIPLLPVEDH